MKLVVLLSLVCCVTLGQGAFTLSDPSPTTIGNYVYTSDASFGAINLVTCKFANLSNATSAASLVNNNIKNITTDFQSTVSLNSLKNLTLSAVTNIGGHLDFNQCSQLTNTSFPSLVTISGDLAFFDNPQHQIFVMTNLVNVGAQVQLSQMMKCTNVDLASLTNCGTDFSIGETVVMTNLNIPNLIKCGGLFQVGDHPNMTNLLVPSLTIVSGITLNNCSNLVNFFPTNLSQCNGQVSITNGALSATSVNSVLAGLVQSTILGSPFAPVGWHVWLQGGTSASPTGQGVTDAATISGRGATVTTN